MATSTYWHWQAVHDIDMADGHAEELLDIASIEHPQRINPFDIETPTETAKGSNPTRPCLKRAGSDPSAAKRTVIGHSQSDRPDYVSTTGPRPRDVSTHSGGERVRARTRTRYTHAIHPLYVSRATGESRYGSGGLRTVDMWVVHGGRYVISVWSITGVTVLSANIRASVRYSRPSLLWRIKVKVYVNVKVNVCIIDTNWLKNLPIYLTDWLKVIKAVKYITID